ncbi:MAG: ATPase [Gammaproteobacteria bacterium]|nr:ATPase [Gammaproteobacteria bacterium]MBT5966998.1 ATPase [Gammaproteobacteria bacterium]MBT6420487.1 ATPase [Gammaproteobacteria bacterium]
MSIVTLKKVTLCGLIGDKSAVLDELQSLGGTHLISLRGALKKLDNVPAQHINEALIALKYLQQCGKHRHQVRQPEGFDFKAVVQDVLAVKNKLIDLQEQIEFLQERIKGVALWGNFYLPEVEQLSGYKLWFYIVPKRLMSKVRASDLVWEQVNQTNTEAYIAVIAKEEPAAKAMPVIRTHTGKVSWSQLIKQLENIELALEDAHAKREYLTRWMSLIMLNLAEYENQSDLKAAHLLTRDEPDVFVLQSWVAVADLTRLEQFAAELQLAYLQENPDGDELPPTLLNNSNTFAGGEEIVKFYQMPNYYGWDPSIVVFFSFALFFAMILSDAGYAAVFMIFLILKWQHMGASIKGIRFRQLLLITLSASLLWGVMVGSYFGVSPEAGTLAAKLKLFDMNDFDSMMKISIFIGVIHIAFANLVQAYQHRQKTTRFASLGWALFVLAGFMLWQARDSQQADLEQSAYSLLGLAVMCLILFSSDRPIRGLLDVVLYLFDGIKSLTGITKIFGDVLSYMRLFALGLASASLALTFNDLATQVYHAMPGMGLLFSILILLIGHTLNIMLGIMSGVVHGLRLNFIEFYNWSVSDEGYPFNAFSKKEGY